jgi:hypothetical protein
MTMKTKQEIFREKLGAYLAANKDEKGRILDSVCEVTGCHRKAAVRRFATLQMRDTAHRERRGRKMVYGKTVTLALHELWGMASRICAERLHDAIPEYVRILQRDRMWIHDAATTQLLLAMSLGTMKARIAEFENVKKRGGRGTTKPSDLKEIIPIRRGPWEHPLPGNGEIDTVAHCGGTIVGDYCFTVQYTDVSTIWTALAGQWNKGEEATVESISRIREHLPFRLLGIDPDSGSEFINWHLEGWCRRRNIVMTRTRPYMKNDHARIEQKNYANVRHVVGYTRFDDERQVVILNAPYDVLEDYLNFFVPSVKCVRKEKMIDGSKTTRVYDGAKTAYQRVLEHPDIAEEIKKKLQKKYATLNPKKLKDERDRLVRKLLAVRPKLR